MEKIQDSDYQKIINDIEYGKDLLQNRPEQDTVDYKVWEILDDALQFITKQDKRLSIKRRMDETYGVTGGNCPTCGNWIQSAHSFCGFCGQAVKWE